MQAVSARNGRSWSASSSSGDGKDHFLAYRVQWPRETDVREFRDKVGKMDTEWKKPTVQFEDPGEEAKPDEDCKMEVDSRKKLDMRKKSDHQNTCATNVDEEVTRKISGSKSWCKIERRRHDLLPEHEKTKTMSEKL